MIDASEPIPVVECVQVIRRPRCPTCGTPDCTAYATKGRTRYYRCNGCRNDRSRPTVFKAIVV